MNISIINSLAGPSRANDLTGPGGGPGSDSGASSIDDFSNQLNKAQSQAQPPALKPFPEKADTGPKTVSDANAAPTKPTTAAPDDAKDTSAKPAKPQDDQTTGKGGTVADSQEPQASQQANATQDNANETNVAVGKLTQEIVPVEHQIGAGSDPQSEHAAQDKSKTSHAGAASSDPNSLSALAAAAATVAAAPKATPPQPTSMGIDVPADDQTTTNVQAPSDAKAKASLLAANGLPDSTASESDATIDAKSNASFTEAIASAVDKNHAAKGSIVEDLAQSLAPQTAQSSSPHAANAPFVATGPIAAPQTPDAQFAQDNHARIVTSIQSEMLPDGGTMQIRLDPPELGAVHVTVTMQDGVLSASFQTSNDQATRMLSHTLGQLKTALESQGVSVQHLGVQQTSKTSNSENAGSGADDNGGHQALADQSNARQEQQRRETVRRMWARLSGGRDPLDMVA
jgi:flagellar hook-length control protein FliK